MNDQTLPFTPNVERQYFLVPIECRRYHPKTLLERDYQISIDLAK